MVSPKIIKKGFKNIKVGKLLFLPGKTDDERVVLENEYGAIRYVGVVKRNKKGFKAFYPSLSIKIRGVADNLYANQILPTEIASYFFEIFKIRTYKERSKLEEMVEEIKIDYK